MPSIADAMMKAFSPMLKAVGLPSDLFDKIKKVKLKDYEIEDDKELRAIYVSIYVEDDESFEAMKEIGDSFLKVIKDKKLIE